MAHWLFLCILALGGPIFLTFASTAPFQLTPSVKQYGPDGPWNAISVQIGTPGQALDLFPSVNSLSYVLTQSNCSNSTACGGAGLYNLNSSSTSHATLIGAPLGGATNSIGSIDGTGKALGTLDYLNLSSPEGTMDARVLVLSVANFSFYRLSELEMTFGHGANYPLQAGQLSLGPPTSATANGSIIPQSLQAQNIIASDSFGLHYGSGNLNQSLSLWLGGFDQQRLVGPVSTQPVEGAQNLPIDLLDIGIGVAAGGSPFPFASRSGLLAADNETIGTQLIVYMYPPVPFLSLPNSTCNAIAALLPVTYNYTLGLYLWDTTAASYDAIRTSPAYLNFTFRASSSSSTNITINVPFSLLNLTLSPPLVPSPIPYFPCQAAAPGAKFSLGRAFLQSAFVGVNWQTPGQWYLAQAPGPNIGTQPSPVAFDSGAAVTGSANQWADTWKGVWTPLPNAGTPSIIPPRHSTTAASATGLSGGAITGIVIGVLVVVGLLLAGAVLLFLRRRRSKRRQQGGGENFAGGTGSSKEDEAAAAAAAAAVAATREKAELGHDERREELTGREENSKWEMGHDERRQELTEHGSAPKWEMGHDEVMEMQGAEVRSPVELFDARSHSHGGEAELQGGGSTVSLPRVKTAQLSSPQQQ